MARDGDALEPREGVSLGRKAARGAAYAIVTGIGSRILGLVATLILIRFVAPAAYGEVSAAAVAVSTATMFSTLGVGLYLVTNPKTGRDVVFQATVLHLSLGVVAMAAVYALRGKLGSFFDAPGLAQYVPGLIVAGIIERVSLTPERVLVRQLRFGTISVARTVGELGYIFGSLGFAVAGLGASSIVIGNVLRAVLRSGIILRACPREEWLEPHRIDKTTVKKIVRYGSGVSAGSLASFASRRWDNLLVSRLFGPAVLGAYNLAYNLADIPATQIGEQITDVLMATFPQIEDADQRRNALLRTTQILALIMFPLAVGLGAVAEPLSEAFLKKRWESAGPMLVVLSALSIPRPIGGAVMAFLVARNRPGLVSTIEWINLGLVLGGIATLGRLGPLWACGAVGLAFAIRALLAMLAARRLEGVPLAGMLGGLVPPLLACVVMVVALWLTRQGLVHYGLRSPWARLFTEIVVGAITYVLAAFVIARDSSRELLGFARTLLSRRHATT